MTNKEINKLKVGDKIFITAVHSINGFLNGKIKEYRIIRQVLNHSDPTTHGYPHLAINRIIVNCFNESYEVHRSQIYRTKAEYNSWLKEARTKEIIDL